MLTISDWIQIPSETTHKDTGTQVIHLIVLLANTAFRFPLEKACSKEQEGILYAHASIRAVEVPQRHFL